MAWLNIVRTLLPLLPPAYLTEPWYLYWYAPGGFAGAVLAAWGLRHNWGGCFYGLVLGLLYGGWLFFAHGVLGFIGWDDRYSGYHCELMGDRTAGLLFFGLSALGGWVGTRLSGVQTPFFTDLLTVKRVLLWMLGVGLIVGYFVGLYYLWRIEVYR